MSMFTILMPAGEDTRFAPDAFASEVGKVISVLGPDGVVDGRIVKAAIVEEGSKALLTLEVDDPEWTQRFIGEASLGRISMDFGDIGRADD